MKFKKADKVRFLGGTFPIGIKEGTDQFLGRNLTPISATFIWDAIRSEDDGNLYVIQHNEGAVLDVFKDYSSYLAKIDYSGLKSTKKYILVPEATLQMVEASNYVPPKEEATPTEDEIIQTSPVIEDENEVEDEEIEEDSFVEPPIEPTTIREQPTYGLNSPHFTVETCPTDRMMNTVSRQIMMKSMKMGEQFTVDGVNGIEHGRAGDFLMLADSNFLFIYPKEGFESNYEYAESLVALPILGKTFNIMPQVAEYIDKLQVTSSQPINLPVEEAPITKDQPLNESQQLQLTEDMNMADILGEKIKNDADQLKELAQGIIDKYPEVKQIVFEKTIAEEDGEITNKYRLNLYVGTGLASLEIG